MPPSEREELAIIVAANGPSVVKIADRILAAGYRKGGGEPSIEMVRAAWEGSAHTTDPRFALEMRRVPLPTVRRMLRAALRAQEGT